MKRLPYIIAAVATACAITAAALAWHYRQKAEREPRRKKAEQPEAGRKLSVIERRYLDLLAKQLGFAKEGKWTADQMLPLLARLNQERNALLPARFDPARAPWLLPPPATRESRHLPNAATMALDLKSGRAEPLPDGARYYQYAITNTGSTPAPMPILFAGTRWDEFDAVLETSGLRRIEDELERAVAVWRFVAERRVHGQPVTEAAEEHDFIKFIACYGYGFCDDSAQAVAILAEGCGIKARIRGLNGHVVPELFARGKWRMLDPDFAVYFHAPDDTRAIYGVDDLAKERARFDHARALGKGGPYGKEYADLFLTTSDNTDWPLQGTHAHRIEHTMASGERVVFSNFNWGRYFLGAYPDRVPRFYNGYFDVPLTAPQLRRQEGLKLFTDGKGFVITNGENEPRAVEAEFASPFPIVGGQISGLPEGLAVEWRENVKIAQLSNNGGICPFDFATAQLSPHPTYRFALRIAVPAGQTIRFADTPRMFVDFQFAETALLKLTREPLEFSVAGESLEQFQGELFLQK